MSQDSINFEMERDDIDDELSYKIHRRAGVEELDINQNTETVRDTKQKNLTQLQSSKLSKHKEKEVLRTFVGVAW